MGKVRSQPVSSGTEASETGHFVAICMHAPNVEALIKGASAQLQGRSSTEETCKHRSNENIMAGVIQANTHLYDLSDFGNLSHSVHGCNVMLSFNH